MRFLKEPFVQFLALGGLIFLAYSFSRSAEDASNERRISVDAATQQWIYDNYHKQFRRPPTRAKMQALVRAHVETEVKYRETLIMGLDQQDTVVRRRMEQKFDFIFGDAAADRTPDEATIQAYYDANGEDFAIPARISLTHLWFSPDRRGNGAEADAADALAALRAGEQPWGNSFPGDPFPSGTNFESLSEARVRGIFGAQFTESVFTLPVGEWSGPVRSGLGFHVVRVSARTDSERPPLDEVRARVLEHWREEESDRILADLIERLEADYEVTIDEKSLDQLEYAPDVVELSE